MDRQRYLIGYRYRVSRRAASWAALFLFLAMPIWAGAPYMVRDINTATRDSDPDEMTLFNGYVYFAATEASVGRELWRCSASGGAPTLVKDINPGTTSSLPQYLTVSGKNLFFMADDGVHGQELWKSDGTAAGTKLVKDINSGPAAYSPYSVPDLNLTDVNGALFFVSHDSVNGWGLWRSDGSEGNTTLVKSFFNGYYSGGLPNYLPTHLTNVNGTLLFAGYDANHGAELWKSDGTSSGTRMVKDIQSGLDGSEPECLFGSKIDNCLYFFAYSRSNGSEGFWKSDGTEAGTIFLRNLSPGSYTYERGGVMDLNGYVVFSAQDSRYGEEIWRTDGTVEGTRIIRDIRAGTSGSDIWLLAPTGNRACILALPDPNKGYEIWKTDGRSSGTVPVCQLEDDDYPMEMAGVGDSLFLTSWKYKSGYSILYDLHLYVVDLNTGSKNVLQKDVQRVPPMINFAYNAPWPGQMKNINGSLFFRAADDAHGMELWKSNGTLATTGIVGDINLGSADSMPEMFCASDGPLYFSAGESLHGREVWQTDGARGGTKMVQDIYPGPCGSDIRWIRQYGGQVYFSAMDTEHGEELWKIDGTGLGTSMVKDIDSGNYGEGPVPLTNHTDMLFFSQWRSDISERQIFRTDGTASGTVRIGNLEQASSVRELGTKEGKKYCLIGYTDEYGIEVYQVDAMTTAAMPLIDINPGPKSSSPDALINMGDMLYFTANTTSSAFSALWNTDGTSSNTKMVRLMNGYFGHLFSGNERLFFSFHDQTSGGELWRSDGTSTGTVMVKDIYPGSGSSSPQNFMTAGSICYFSAYGLDHGEELWKSDGTSSGTLMVKDINPGTDSSSPRQLIIFGGSLYFIARDIDHGYELWKSDGSEAGTMLVCDINKSPLDSFVAGYYDFLGQRDGLLLFLASDSRGRGLWVTDGTEKGTIRLDVLDPNPPLYNDYDGRLNVSSNLQIVYHKGLIYYPKDDGIHGYELWALPLRSEAPVIGNMPPLVAH